jgi:large subunit ribosomal protein L28e
MAAPQLLWEVVKGHSSYLKKNLNGTIFSAEPFNLYNKHSYKYSGENDGLRYQ